MLLLLLLLITNPVLLLPLVKADNDVDLCMLLCPTGNGAAPCFWSFWISIKLSSSAVALFASCLLTREIRCTPGDVTDTAPAGAAAGTRYLDKQSGFNIVLAPAAAAALAAETRLHGCQAGAVEGQEG
jgi:hypothetical protein